MIISCLCKEDKIQGDLPVLDLCLRILQAENKNLTQKIVSTMKSELFVSTLIIFKNADNRSRSSFDTHDFVKKD